MAQRKGRPGAPRFTVEAAVGSADDYGRGVPLLVARCRMAATFPELANIVWVWSGGPYVDYGRSRGQAVDVVNVWDYQAGAAVIPFEADAFGRLLSERYDDRAEREAVREIVAEWVRYGGR